MNRLIILGNGFDLAHGMKTEYYDFVLDYVRSGFEYAERNGEYEDPVSQIRTNGHVSWHNKKPPETLKEFMVFMRRSGPIEWDIRNEFAKRLLTTCSRSLWVNIENEYYDGLKRILAMHDSRKEEKLKSLNLAIQFLIGKLGEYLTRQASPKTDSTYRDLFMEQFRRDEIVFPFVDPKPGFTMFLNFNYTNTIGHYLKKFPALNNSKFPSTINYIHGQINATANPLIFGFGDELDVDYSRVEADKHKGFLEYIKSFWYVRTTHYQDLIRFLANNAFQVFIMGHSCGLSDRTMLHPIFEHENCKSIKLFYHGTPVKNNFIQLTHSISPHFKDKGEMRIRIVPLSKSVPMPQIYNPRP